MPYIAKPPDITDLVKQSDEGPQDHNLVVYDTPEIQAAAYKKFIESSMNFVDLAIATGVPQPLLLRWAKGGDWVARRKKITDELAKACEAQYREFMLTERLPIMKRHVKLSAKLDSAIEKLLDRMNSSPENAQNKEVLRTLNSMATLYKKIAETLTGSSDVARKATEPSAAEISRLEEEAGDSRKPLIVLNLGQPVVPAEKVVKNDLDNSKKT